MLEHLDPTADHVRGPADGHLILEYGDFECPYSRRAYRQIQKLEGRAPASVRFAFRHFPLVDIHPHALAASAAAEAAAAQGHYWEMHDLLFHRQKALEDDDLLRYAAELGLDVQRFADDLASRAVLERIQRDVSSANATGEVHGTPTLFIGGEVYRGDYDADSLAEAIGVSSSG